MKLAVDSLTEEDRINTLQTFNVLDSLPEKEYDTIVNLASNLCEVPICLVSLVDENRQWFKACIGLDVDETARDISFCGHAINHTEDIFIIEDTLKDKRFADNPLVIGEPHIRFYAGAILRAKNGEALGTLCVIDRKPKVLTERQKDGLISLASLVCTQLELRKVNRQVKLKSNQVKVANKNLEQYARVVSHDLRSPLTAMQLSADMLKDEPAIKDDAYLLNMLDTISRKCIEQNELIESILNFARSESVVDDRIERFSFNTILNSIKEEISRNITFIQEGDNLEMSTNKIAVRRVLQNLIDNAVKYNDKEEIIVTVTAKQLGSTYHLSVTDNGPGIDINQQARIFDMQFVTGLKDRNGDVGTGIGLHVVKVLIEKLGGTINLTSSAVEGTTFRFTLEDYSAFS